MEAAYNEDNGICLTAVVVAVVVVVDDDDAA
jgi:hypothetical protein